MKGGVYRMLTFIVQSLFSIRGILYASFFGFIFLKGIAEVSSGVSIGG